MVRHAMVVGTGPGGLSVAINLAGQGLKITATNAGSLGDYAPCRRTRRP